MQASKVKALVLVSTLPLAPWAHGGETNFDAAGAEQWQFTVAPYLWAVGLNGNMTVEGVEAEVDESFSDILSDLDMAAELHFEAWKGKLGFFVDGTWIKLKTGGQVGPVDMDIDVNMTLVDFGGLYQVSTWQLGEASENRQGAFEVLAGGRYTDLEPKFSFDNPPHPSVKQKVYWTDLIVGGRFTADLSQKWSLLLRADLGGFGIGSSSDLTANGSALFGWRFKPDWQLLMGYRALYQDYEKGSGANKFKYDVTTHGPILGVNYHF